MFVWVTKSLAVQSQEHIVEISALRLSPTSLEVKSGDVVKWVNKDNRRHQLMSISEGGWRSRILRRGDSFVLFVGKTTFYICALHSNMRGEIKVLSDQTPSLNEVTLISRLKSFSFPKFIGVVPITCRHMDYIINIINLIFRPILYLQNHCLSCVTYNDQGMH